MTSSNTLGASLEVKTLQVYKLWENQEGTRSTRATISLINGYSRVTLGKFFLIKDSDEAKKFNLPVNQWLPEKKGKHLCLSPGEFTGLGQRLNQIAAGLEEASVHSANVDVQRLGVSGFGGAHKGAMWPPNTSAAGNSSASTAACKKRGPKPKCKTQANAEQDENGYAREDDEDDSGIDVSKPRRCA